MQNYRKSAPEPASEICELLDLILNADRLGETECLNSRIPLRIRLLGLILSAQQFAQLMFGIKTMTEPEIKRIDTKIVYKNRWMSVREDRVRRPNGDHGLFGVVDKPDFSLIIPFEAGKVHLVEQYRYPVDGRYWEFPQGAWELDPDADPVKVAAGELAEETGLQAASITKLGKLHQAYGYSNQAVHIFLATDLESGDASPEPEEQGLISETFSLAACNDMITDGRITDLATVGAMHLLERHLSQATKK